MKQKIHSEKQISNSKGIMVLSFCKIEGLATRSNSEKGELNKQ